MALNIALGKIMLITEHLFGVLPMVMTAFRVVLFGAVAIVDVIKLDWVF